MNLLELKSQMVRHGDNQKDLAEVLGVTPTTMSMKLQGKAPFKLHEANLIAERYGLDDEQVRLIFFDEKNLGW